MHFWSRSFLYLGEEEMTMVTFALYTLYDGHRPYLW